MSTNEEKTIIQGLQDNSTRRQAFEWIVRQYNQQLYWQIRRMVFSHDDANDILQNSFIKAWLNIEQFRGDSKLSTWLYRITLNETLNFLQRQKEQTSLDSPEGSIANQLASDPYFDQEFAAQYGIESASVDDICRQADVISLHSLLNDETRNLINRDRLASMKKTCILINTARGELVDEEALLEALVSKTIYGAGLDVFSKEPPADPRWYELANVVMGSHTSSSTVGTTNCMGQMCVDALKKAFA